MAHIRKFIGQVNLQDRVLGRVLHGVLVKKDVARPRQLVMNRYSESGGAQNGQNAPLDSGAALDCWRGLGRGSQGEDSLDYERCENNNSHRWKVEKAIVHKVARSDCPQIKRGQGR